MRTAAERWSWVDLRLVPAAATVWSTTLLAPLLPVPVLAGAVPTAVVAAVWVSRRSRSPTAVVLLGVLAAGWALMALLFVGGVMNLLWVAAITAAVLAEKLAPRGGWIARATGAALVLGGAWVIAAGMQVGSGGHG